MTKLSQKSLPYKVLQTIQRNKLILPDETIIAAVSGGPDSVCLFDVLYNLREKLNFKLKVCHYDHRMRGEDSYNDSMFVQKICRDRGVEFIGGAAKSSNLFKSEESAREARYAFFEKILQEGRGDKIATGHNLNDLIETFLMRLFRGTGLGGLKSIPYLRQKFIRPLLAIPRSEINAYLQAEGLPFREDITNKDIVFTRNFIRHTILPELTQINPNIFETLGNTISVLSEDYDLIDQLANKAYSKILKEELKNQIMLDRKKWLLLHPALQLGTIRVAISKISDLKDISSKQLTEVRNVILRGEGKKQKSLPHSLRIKLISGNIVLLVGKTD